MAGHPLVCVPSVPWTCPICPVICHVCPADILPLDCEFPHRSAQTSRVSLGRPEFIPGTLPGHSHHQIPLCDFSLSVFLFSIMWGVYQTIRVAMPSINFLLELSIDTPAIGLRAVQARHWLWLSCLRRVSTWIHRATHIHITRVLGRCCCL